MNNVFSSKSVYSLIDCAEMYRLEHIIMNDNIHSITLNNAINAINEYLIAGNIDSAYDACNVSYDKDSFDFEWLSELYSQNDRQSLTEYVKRFETASFQGRIKAVSNLEYILNSPVSIGEFKIEKLRTMPSFLLEEDGKKTLIFAEWSIGKWAMRGRTPRTNLNKRLDINVAKALLGNDADAFCCIEIKSLDASGKKGIFYPSPEYSVEEILNEATDCSVKNCSMCRFVHICQSKFFDSSYQEQTKILEADKERVYTLPEYDTNQKEAIKASGFVRVTAGPGSGKTATIVGRVNHLVNDICVFPENILVLSFTNKAVNELRERIACVLQDEYASCNIMTINSLAHKILQENKELLGLKNVHIISDEDKQLLVFNLLQSHNPIQNFNYGMTHGRYGVVKTVLNRIDNYIDNYRPNNQADVFMQEYEVGYDFIELAEEYLSILQANNYISFDEEVKLAVQILVNNDKIKDTYKSLWKHIIVDEFQDIASSQYELISLLVDKEIFVVGDDDQAIYGFRGGSSKYLLEFPYEKDIVLSHNYRSTKEIIDYSTYSVVNNTERIEKNPDADKHGKSPFLFKTSGKDIVKNIDYVIKELIKIGVSECEIAILAPKNQELDNIAPLLSTPNTLGQNKLINDPMYSLLLAILTFYVKGEIDDLNLYHLINVLNHRDINELNVPYGMSLYEYVQKEAENKNHSFFKELLEFISEALNCCEDYYDTPKEFILELFWSIGVKPNTVMSSIFEVIDNKKVVNLSALYEVLHSMRVFDSQRKVENTASNSVTLMTCHESKGKEFEAVIIFDSESIISGKKDIVSKRNLGYVAMTRAKKYLFVFSCVEIEKNLFLKEITDLAGTNKLISFKEELVCLS